MGEMEFDLRLLGEMHPFLAKSTAVELAYRAAIGLGRHGHKPGVHLSSSQSEHEKDVLLWEEAADEASAQLDFHKVTEDAAEAIALVFASVANGWTILRRLQRWEFADWLLVDRENSRVVTEVSGVDATDTGGGRLREKILQVAKCTASIIKVACVVELQPPRLSMNITSNAS